MQFHPRNENILLVVPMKHAPVVVNVATGTHRQEAEKMQMTLYGQALDGATQSQVCGEQASTVNVA